MNLSQWGVLVVALLVSGMPVGAASRHANLDTWIANDLTPFVREQLEVHPRFKGEPLRATSNSLALRIRDRLREAAANVPGVRIAWQPDNPHYLHNTGPGGVDCTRSEVHYLIGIETNLVDSGLLAVEVRALDVEDRTVVAGSWKGPISSRQYREFRRIETDLTFRGEREAPYEDSQTDLLAAHLAHDLGNQPDPVDSMVELVSNNLAQYSTLQFSAVDENANSVIEGKAHQIDEDLYQYWITVQPKVPDSKLQALSASAYVRLPEQFTIAAMSTLQPGPALQNSADFLASLRIVELQEPGPCLAKSISSGSPGYRRPYVGNNVDCFALAVRSTDDAVVFFLNHQLNNGLVRLADAACLERTSARIARIDQQLQFALPPDSLPSAAWSAAESWQLQPGLDTYYAVAATDTKAARALSQHIEQLPKRCSASVRPGLEGLALRRWIEELAEIVKHWEPAIDWQTIRVKNIY